MDDSKKNPLEKQVEENLRRVYRAKAEEPIPDRFVELLKQLRDLEENGGKK
jgi:Anti-sigma factor NepR